MIRMIDNTLTSLDRCLPSKEDLHTFCELLFTIGVDAIELSLAVYERMGYLPENRKFILNINFADEMERYPGFYRYVCHHSDCVENLIHEVQLNDAREIVRLRALNGCKELRIVGLDDFLCNYSYDKIMQEIKNCLPRTTIILCPENTYGCASALAVQWLLDFGNDITTSFAGSKNNAATEEVIMALRLTIRHKLNRNLTVLPQLTKLYEKFTNKEVGNKKPIIGKNIFKVEAGIHADGIKKNPATYEAYDPCCVGGISELVIGKHSGTKAVKIKMEELCIPVPEGMKIEQILSVIKNACTEDRKSLTDEEFIKLVSEVTCR
ncbi:MAG: homocitrate synthase/isopropylmalate synthase family protein [Mobilitalea sp.]